jgi:hypothetical protein
MVCSPLKNSGFQTKEGDYSVKAFAGGVEWAKSLVIL